MKSPLQLALLALLLLSLAAPGVQGAPLSPLPSASLVTPTSTPRPDGGMGVDSRFNPGMLHSWVDAKEIVSTLFNRVTALALVYLAANVVSQTFHKINEEIMKGRVLDGTSSNSSQLAPFLPANVTLDENELDVAQSVTVPPLITEEWKSLGGMELMKDQLLDLVDYESAEFWESKKQSGTQLFDIARSVLFFGPPGCGKTSLVRSFSKKLGIPIIHISPSLLLRKYVGESSRRLCSVFSLARKLQPAVIFVDELDALFKTRSGDDHVVDRQIKTEFMQLWDHLAGTDVLVLGATNRPQDLDPAVQRRFDRSFMLHLPDLESRRDIFGTLLRGVALQRGFDFDRLAALSEGYSSSDIANVCRSASAALRRQNERRHRRGGDGPSAAPRPLSTRAAERALRNQLPTSWATHSYRAMPKQGPPATAAHPSESLDDLLNLEDSDDPADD